ncbi:kinase-like domain-containing protein [Suillus subalutaceus]|uniref:kinase-like domain-containing protein n=1 Tax=Suillus subalutaceus TaxID=48586 RepID=UPI001B87B226|nr:kinase-like domain-containing protein [Suillus subalutaceus]KAG1857334.1 kinase-like domain-containing protein [Suillus subalutaceus]
MRDRSSYCFQHGRRWTTQIALGINALHKIGIIHRDIKAENILIDVRENARITDFGLCYVHTDKGPLERQWVYTRGTIGTTHCMAPEVLRNKTDPRSMGYGVPVDWWGLGCIIYELVSKTHKARFASSFAPILLIPSCQTLFSTQDDISFYVSWVSNPDRTSKRFPAFEELHEVIADLLSGLLHCDPSSRYGFRELIVHKAFLLRCGTSEFSGAFSRALEREELPDSLPDLKRGLDIYTAPVWFRLPYCEKPRVSNVDWIKPALFSTDL